MARTCQSSNEPFAGKVVLGLLVLSDWLPDKLGSMVSEPFASKVDEGIVSGARAKGTREVSKSSMSLPFLPNLKPSALGTGIVAASTQARQRLRNRSAEIV